MRVWNAWASLLATKEEGTPLALCRIGLCSTVLFTLLSMAGAGLVDELWLSAEDGGLFILRGNWLVKKLGGLGPKVVWSLWGVALLSAVVAGLGLFQGWAHKLVFFVLLQSYNALCTINPYCTGAYDWLMTNALWIMCWSSSSVTLSLACLRKKGGWHSREEVWAWPRYVLIFQLLLVYSLTGWQKTALPWTPAGGYSALYYVTQDLSWTRIDMTHLAWLHPLWRVATALTWHWEQLSFVVLIWFFFRYTEDRRGEDQAAKGRTGRVRRMVLRFDLRMIWLVVGVGLHLGIFVMMNVGPFSLVCLALYPLFLRPREWRELGIKASSLRGVHYGCRA